MNSKSISILGCGWLGLPLAERLRAENFEVKGSSTSVGKLSALKEKGIEPHLVILNPDVRTTDVQNFLESDILVIDFPPNRTEKTLEFYPAQIKSVIDEINKSHIEKVLFVGSTSVYGNKNGVVNEDSELLPDKDSGKALVLAEKLLRAESKFKTTILRFAGLIGPDRHPGKFLAGRKNIPGGNTKVNLIHREDCIEIILRIIKNDIWNETFNAAADRHPTKKELYTKAAKSIGVEVPEFIDNESDYKIVVSEKIKQKLNYEFKYPEPLGMF